MHVTAHARARLQQRAIPPAAVEAIMAYGRNGRHYGADVYFLDRAARSRLSTAIGRSAYSRLERALDTYLVVSDDGALITAAHRRSRLKF